jgi:hypothetical protein
MTREQAIEVLIDRYNSGVIRGRTDDEWRLATDTVIVALRGPEPDTDCGGKMRIDIPPGNDSVRASTGLQRDGGDKTERRCNQCVICGAEMPEGDQVCGYCRRQHGY